jgi:Protein of unknown function (DUF3085)
MSKLTFKTDALPALYAEAVGAWKSEVHELYGGNTGAGFWLVGDEGVYLMHNGASKTPATVVYAEECNPKTLPFDEWWAAKRATFGGDDGVEFINASTIRDAVEARSDLVAEFAGDTISFYTVAATRKRRAKP